MKNEDLPKGTSLPLTTQSIDEGGRSLTHEIGVLKRQFSITLRKLDNITAALDDLGAAVESSEEVEANTQTTWLKRVLSLLWPKQRANRNE